MKRCYEFGPEQVACIDALAVELGTTKSNVLRDGLRLLRLAVKATKAGNSLGIVAGEYVVSELVGPWSDVKERQA